MNGTAVYFYFLIETDFLDTRSHFLTANQDVSENTWPIKIGVVSQPCLHTLIYTQLLTNVSVHSILIIK